jgi:hypothetical protein
MTGTAAWMRRRGLSPARVGYKALVGVVIGLAVVLADRMIGLGS